MHARFDLSDMTAGPFPSDRFTVADPDNLTGVRINLPLPDPATHLADYQDTLVLNTLDGFNLQPRLSIPFDGPIDVNSVNSQNVFLVSLGDTVPGGDRGGEVVGINQIVWDPATNTLYAESDELLDQHTRYALIVTNGVRDAAGERVQPSEGFMGFPHNVHIGQAVAAAARVGVPAKDIVTASVFTTMSVTSELEKIRDQIKSAAPPEVNSPTVYNLSEVTSIGWRQHTGWTRQPDGELIPTLSNPIAVPLPQLKIIPGVVGQVAYGTYVSPDYEVHPSAAERATGAPGEYIPAVGTRTGIPEVQGTNTISYTLYLPSVRPPSGRWPVAIWIHGGGGSKEGSVAGVQLIAAEAAAKGIATIGINVVGHGSGPDSTLTITRNVAGTVTTVTVPEGGRGIDQNGDLVIGSSEGFEATSPQAIISSRDGRIQTVGDLMQLVRVIEAGVDVDGDGVGDLDPSHINYVGASLGGFVGAALLAVEPDVRAGVLNAVGGPGTEIGRLRASRGDLAAQMDLEGRGLLSTQLNVPGIIKVDGLSVRAPYFNENKPLRDGVPLTVVLKDPTTNVETPHIIQSPVINDVPGAMAIQQVLDNWEWVSQPGSPVAYAPYFRKDPLPGVPAKPVIIQFARGDQQVENPTTTALLRAGDLADRATYYRYDLAYAESQQKGLPQPIPALLYPHTFGGLIINANPIYQAVARAAQEQIAVFLGSDGTVTIPPPLMLPPDFRQDLFETPIQGPLPEDLGYIT